MTMTMPPSLHRNRLDHSLLMPSKNGSLPQGIVKSTSDMKLKLLSENSRLKNQQKLITGKISRVTSDKRRYQSSAQDCFFLYKLFCCWILYMDGMKIGLAKVHGVVCCLTCLLCGNIFLLGAAIPLVYSLRT